MLVMKKIIYFITLSSLALALGCKKIVDEKPLADGTLETFFRSKFDADAWMAGMYGQLQKLMVGESQFNNRYNFWGDARSDNMEYQAAYSNANTTEMHFNSLTANNNYADWSGFYRIIQTANVAINKFPEINNYTVPTSKDFIDNTTLNRYLAECYAMRGFSYFYIVRLWGAAPIRTEAFLNLSQVAQLPRSPADSVLAQAIRDVTTAYNMIPKNATPNVWYIGEGAMAAMLADMHMWRIVSQTPGGADIKTPDYQNAIVWFKNLFKAKGPKGNVYNSSGTGATGSGGSASQLEPTVDWKKPFLDPPASVETIWSLNWITAANGCPCMSGISTAVNNTPMRIYNPLHVAWRTDTIDVRPLQTVDVTKTDNWDRTWKWYPGSFGKTSANKIVYNGTYGTGLNVFIPMYRLAESYLLYAEALNKIGDRPNALKYLNLIHVRAGLPAYTAAQLSTEALMEDAILAERKKELFGEGRRWFDLVRTDKVYTIMDPILKARQLAAGLVPQVGFGPDPTDRRKYYWPLHRNVLNANPGFQQNPPYTD
jgi:starch-binding outer membrane protein, SusD/RagB family